MAKVVIIDFAGTFYDKHALYSLSSVLLAKKHEVHYIPTMKYKRILNTLKELKPDLLLYSAFTAEIPKYAEFDKHIKTQIKVKSLIGGHGPTYDPQDIVDTTIDSLCIGEGEAALVDYVENGFVGKHNIVERTEYGKTSSCPTYYPFVELDDLPIPNRDLIYQNDIILRDQPSKQFMAGRGCPYLCTYCHNHAFNEKFKESGAIIRYKSVDYLLEEIRQVKRKYPLQTIVFQDDVFILRREWVKEFCERYPKEIGIPFTCNVKAEIIVREEIVEALKSAGCIHVAWSIESGNEHFRNKVLKRNTSRSQVMRASANLNKHKLAHRVGNVIGIPGETFENMLETIELNIEAKPNLAIGSIFVPYPGLELTDYAIQHKYLDPEKAKYLPQTLYEGSILNFTPDEKYKIRQIAYLFPWLVQFPFLYRNKFIFYKILMRIHPFVLRPAYDLFFIFKLAGFFKIKPSLRMRLAMLIRYFSFRSYKSNLAFDEAPDTNTLPDPKTA